jgi:hypothetical protein
MPTRRKFLQGLGAAATLSGTSSGNADSQAQASNVKPRGREWTWENIGRELKHSNQNPDEKVPVNEIEEILETDASRYDSHIVADGDKLVVAEKNKSNVEAWDRQTGDRLWRFDEGAVRHPPAIGDDFFYFSGGDGTIYAVDDNGNKVGENNAISASETLFVDDHVLTLGTTGQVNLFDRELNDSATFDKPDVNIPREVGTVDDQGRLIYVEARQGGSPNTSLRMLDLRDPSETDSLEEVASVNVASDANNGATLHNGNYIWSRENGELRVAEVENNGFGKLHSADIGSLDSAPVVVDGDIWMGVDESLYRVALDDVKSSGSVDPELVDDSFESQVNSVVASETEVVAGSSMDTTKVYDSETGDEVVELSDWENDVFRKAVAVFDGKLVTRSYDGSDYVYKVLDGEYRDIVPELSFGGFDSGGSVVFGRSVSPVVDASARDEELTGFGLTVSEGGEVVFSNSYGSLSDLKGVDLSELVGGEGSYSVEVSVTDAGGDTASESMSLDLTGLGLGLSVDGPDYGNDSYSVSASASNGDWDSLDWFLDGEQVGSGESVDVFDLLDERGSYEVEAEADVGSETYPTSTEIEFNPEKPGIVDTGFDWSEELGETPNTGDSIEVYAEITETEAEAESVTYNLMYVDAESPEAGFTQVASQEVSSGSWDVSDEINRDGLYMVETVVEDEYGDTVSKGSSDVLVGPEVSATGRPAQDLDGDGRYDDVNGDGETNILDTQALFNNLDESSVQSNQRYFDFGAGPDTEVSILDVAGHWLDVTGG